ncbi:MAG: Na+/H+ antiporter NhaA [Nocardioides sp.]
MNTSLSVTPFARRMSALRRVLSSEATAGLLLTAATLAALVAANSRFAGAYEALRDARIGPAALHLDLTVGQWAADGLLALFFFVVGLELKRELVAGALADRARSLVPVVAAIGGVVVPILVYLGVVSALGGGSAARAGWAVPAATDIAFALAVIAIVGRALPESLRMFLLTLAVVDDLIAISIIALVFTADLRLVPLLAGLGAIAAFGYAARRQASWLLVPLAVLAWGLIHEAGVHATVAGVLLGLTVPVFDGARPTESAPAEVVAEAGEHGPAARMEHLLQPWSAGLAVPIFAFLAAGVSVAGWGELADNATEPVALGIILALVVGKSVGITGGAYLVTRWPGVAYSSALSWLDIMGAALLGGIGFTVSILVGELAFGRGSALEDQMKIGVLLGSLIAALLAGGLLSARNRHYHRVR